MIYLHRMIFGKLLMIYNIWNNCCVMIWCLEMASCRVNTRHLSMLIRSNHVGWPLFRPVLKQGENHRDELNQTERPHILGKKSHHLQKHQLQGIFAMLPYFICRSTLPSIEFHIPEAYIYIYNHMHLCLQWPRQIDDVKFCSSISIITKKLLILKSIEDYEVVWCSSL